MNRMGRLLAALALTLAIPGTASAVSIGFNVGFGNGTLEVDYDAWYGGGVEEWDTDYFQFGFTLDTGRKGSLFKYRLHAGIHNLGDGTVPDDQTGIGLDNHFGFVLNRNADVRVWAGPSIYLGFNDGDLGNGAYFGFGPTLGLDLPVGGSTLGLELSYRVAGHVFDDLDDFANTTSEDVFLRAAFLF
ncbi:hypothetical protein [Natronospira bacteriovora]|uniref:Outer membrane protein beta-barrel domain-containing protein n=1 Tax=Natronospira bacteriovora TaxID=3069753 RepID=A0ABU0W8D6_9GAMM|nr:hypothetical protein [Natronospira sp. AB-CW4]MDQ2070297.1 hypothetical protein [Natronospira sp. AB-CW4]